MILCVNVRRHFSPLHLHILDAHSRQHFLIWSIGWQATVCAPSRWRTATLRRSCPARPGQRAARGGSDVARGHRHPGSAARGAADTYLSGLVCCSLTSVTDAVRTCQRAGITVRMVTGDNLRRRSPWQPSDGRLRPGLCLLQALSRHRASCRSMMSVCRQWKLGRRPALCSLPYNSLAMVRMAGLRGSGCQCASRGCPFAAPHSDTQVCVACTTMERVAYASF